MAEREKKERLTSATGIACFVHVFKPEVPGNGSTVKSKDPKFKLVLVWDKEAQESPEFKKMKKVCIATAKSKFGDTDDTVMKIKKRKIRMPWRPTSDYGDEGYGFPFDQDGWMFANFSSTQRPGIVDRKARAIEDESTFFSGCKARVTYAPWAYDRDGNKGVTLLLNNVQMIAKGDRLAGRPDAEDDFDAVEGEDGDDDEDDDDI